MGQAKIGDTVKVHYTGKLNDGTIFDTSEGREPLKFTIGEGHIIPGFEQAIIGMSINESKTIKIPSDNAYGPYRKEMVVVVQRNQLPSHIKPEKGLHLRIPGPDGQGFVVIITDMSDSTITLDGNHPLAGKDLTFDIQLIEIA
ncbi:MAG: peptidylprolyl isomerase [Nitrospirae bacterium]|nr:peptidylprolyl isomerase [Nitrospirota bacterium]